MNISTVDFDYVRKLVRERAAIVLDNDKQYLVEARLSSLALRENIPTPAELLARLRAGAPGTQDLDRKVVEAMTTNETMWFRDSHPFEALRKSILPELLARRDGPRMLNLWCGASSSGQEPYSVLMLLREHFPQLTGWDVRFLATDLSSEVLARAREGRYNQLEVSRGLPPALLQKYFEQQGAHWQLQKELRQAIDFRVLNLSHRWPPMLQIDIVFLRNVLIYFDVETKKAILGKVRRLLRKDGYLFVGSAETTLNLDDGFAPIMFERSVCYRLK